MDLLEFGVNFGQNAHSESVLKGLVNYINRIIHHVQQNMHVFLAKIKIAYFKIEITSKK